MESNEKKTEANSESNMAEEIAEIASISEEKSTQEDVSSSSSTEPAMLTENMEEMVSQLTDGFLSEVQPQLLELREKTKEITYVFIPYIHSYPMYK